jgi:hypothetical protein
MTDEVVVETASVRPAQVSQATALYVFSLALGVFNTVFLWQHFAGMASVGFVLVVQALTMALFAWLAYEMWIGRNWARIVILVLFVIGIPAYIPNLKQFFAASPWAGGISVTQTALQIVGLGLVFIGPGHTWFRRRPTAVPLPV